MPFGIFVRQFSIGCPNIRNATSAAPRCAAIDKPYGPAPMIATSVSFELLIVHLQEPSGTRFCAGLIVTTGWPTNKSDAAVLRRRSHDVDAPVSRDRLVVRSQMPAYHDQPFRRGPILPRSSNFS